MKAVHRYGERKRNEAINRFVRGEVLNIGVWGSDQHDRLKKTGTKVYSADLNNADFIFDADKEFSRKTFKNKLFDTVIAAEIIEHLESPYNFVRKCKSILKENGTLVVTAPNAASLQHILRPGWGACSKPFHAPDGKTYRYHMQAFTKAMLESILEMHGFKIIYSDYINAFWVNPAPFVVAQLFKRLRGDIIVVGKKVKT